MLRQAKLDKREEFANAGTKDNDDVDNLKYNADDLPPYTPTVEITLVDYMIVEEL